MSNTDVRKTKLYLELPEDMKQNIALIADYQGESLSSIVRFAIRDYCRKEEFKEVMDNAKKSSK